MKILHVIETMSRRYGGPTGVLKSLSRAQAARGHQVSVVTTNSDYPSGTMPVPVDQVVAEDGVATTYFGVQFRPLNVSLAMAKALPAMIAAHDVLHVHGMYRFPPTYAALVARTHKRPYIVRPFGSLDPFNFARSPNSLALKRVYERLFDFPNLRAADGIHYTTDDERDRAAHVGLKSPAFVIPNGLDWSLYETLPEPGQFRARLGLAAEVPLVLFLGRVHHKKGLDLLVPAFAALRNALPGAKLAIVGPDNDGYGLKVRAMVSAAGLEQDVMFVETLTGGDVMGAYRDADVFALPSYTENFGMTVVEAMACGAPVVISNQVNIHREVANSGGGEVVTCDPEPLAERLITLLRDPARRAEMSSRGRPWVRDTYSWSSIVQRLDGEYRKVIEHAGRTP